MNVEANTVDRNSRRAVHYIAQAPSYGYACGVTEHHVQTRSGGATVERSRVTCAACTATFAPSVKQARAFAAKAKLEQATALVDEATNEIASCVPSVHPLLDELADTLLQMRKSIELARQTIKRIP